MSQVTGETNGSEYGETNGLAIASLALGVLGLFAIPLFGSILALAFGRAARTQIDRRDGLQSGKELATAGIVLGWVGLGLFIFGVIVFWGFF